MERLFKHIGKPVAIMFAVLILTILAWDSFTVVTEENQYNVIKTMGKIARVENEAGLSFKIPLIQSKESITKAKLLYDIKPTEIYTSDKKKMVVDAYIIWSISDPIKFIQMLNASKAGAESKIDFMVYGALKTVVSSTTQVDLIASRDAALDTLTEDDGLSDIETQDITSEELQEDGDVPQVEDTAENKPVKVVSISSKVLERMETDYDAEEYGFTINEVKIKILDLPEENREAVYNRMITERSNIAAAYKAQGEAEAQKIRNMTDKETKIMTSESDATAAQLEAEGEAEYMKILSDAYNDPEKAEYYLFVRQLDMAKKSLQGGNTTLFIDKDSPIAEIFAQ